MESSVEALSKFRYDMGIEALEDFFVASKEEAERQIGRAESFKREIERFLNEKGIHPYT